MYSNSKTYQALTHKTRALWGSEDFQPSEETRIIFSLVISYQKRKITSQKTLALRNLIWNMSDWALKSVIMKEALNSSSNVIWGCFFVWLVWFHYVDLKTANLVCLLWGNSKLDYLLRQETGNRWSQISSWKCLCEFWSGCISSVQAIHSISQKCDYWKFARARFAKLKLLVGIIDWKQKLDVGKS